MKKVYLLSLLLISLAANAQENMTASVQIGNAVTDPRDLYTQFSPVNTQHRASTRMPLFYAGIGLNYKYSDTLNFRFRAGFSRIDMRKELDDYIGGLHQTSTYTGEQDNIQLGLASIWMFHVGEKLALRPGFEFQYTNFDDYYYTEFTEYADSASHVKIAETEYTSRTPGGMGLGFGLVLGFSFKPIHWLSLDAEFNPSFSYVRFAERDRIDETTYTVIAPSSQTYTAVNYAQKYSGFQYMGRFVIGCTFFF
jgi:hypothetical protein